MPNIPSKLNSEITDKYTVASNTFLATPKTNPKDKIDVEIGDSKQVDFLPQVKIQRWDNEVNFSSRLIHEEAAPVVSTLSDKIVWEGDKVSANFYDITEGEGGYEFEVILKEKPKTNIVSFTIQTKGLDFFYQPEIEDSEVQSDVKLTPEKLLAKKREIRPENVVGSYAVYASENKTNYVGGKEYKCGKVGHIFRPKIIDAEGTEVWGELHIENGILSVTIPQDFLDNAVYPVRHAAGLTFGFESVGGSSYDGMMKNDLYGSLFTAPSSGQIASMTTWTGNYADYVDDKMAGVIYLHSDLSLVGKTNEYSVGTTDHVSKRWLTCNFSSAPSVNSSTGYVLCWGYSASLYGSIFFDDGNTNQEHWRAISWEHGTTWTPSDPAGFTYHYKYKYSIYATYTAAATGYSSPFPSFKQI